MQRLLSEIRRLFPLPVEAQAEGAAPGADSALYALQRQLAGEGWLELQPVDAQGCTRLLGFGFHGVARGQGAAHCAAMLQLARWLMEELGLPEAAFSVNGRDGFDLWLALAAPVPVAEAHEFVQRLQGLHLHELQQVHLRPAAPQPALAGAEPLRLPPGQHPDSGLWSVFIAPGLAPSFTEEAGIDIAPNLDKQAELLSRLQPIAPDEFTRALQRLRQRAGQAAEAPAPEASGTGAQASAGAAGGASSSPVPPATGSAAAPATVAGGALAARREELLDLLTRPAPAVPAPFEGLTRLLRGGWRAGRLHLLLAPAEAGPATLAALALEQAAANGHPALYVGYTLAREQFVQAALARRLGLEAWRIEAGALSADEAGRVAPALEAYLAQLGRHLEIWEAAPATTLSEVAAWVAQARAAAPARTPLVVIDPLHLVCTGLPAVDAHPDAAHRALAQAAACKHLARGTGAAVIASMPWQRPAPQGGGLDVERLVPLLGASADAVLALQPQAPMCPGRGTGQGAAGIGAVTRPLRLSLLDRPGGADAVRLLYDPASQAMEEAPEAG
jgi:hypothetical protein